MISASAADAHRFGRVKRNGYDPAEVDAVVSRLVEAIRRHESKIEELERRLSDADASADAIRRTFMAAEATAETMLVEARSEADDVSENARSEAEDMLSGARTEADQVIANAKAEAERIEADARSSAERTAELAAQVDIEVASHRDRILAEAYDEAELMMLDVELSIAERSARSIAEYDEAIEAAERTAQHTHRIAMETMRAAAIASARIRGAAARTAAEERANAEAAAIEIRGEAESKAAEAEARATHLRRAIAGLDDAARQLAQVTTEGLSVIDLSRIEASEAELAADEASLPAAPPTEANAPAQDKWATRSVPHSTSDDAEDSIEIETNEGDEDDDTSETSDSFYQRSTGTPLSERVKIARRSG